MHLITIRIKWFWHFFLQSYHLRCSQLEISRTYILFLTNFVLSTIKTRAHGLQLKKMSHYSKRLQVFERMVTKLWVVEGFIDARSQCLIFSQDVTSDLCAATPAWSKLIFLDVTLVMQCNTSMMTKNKGKKILSFVDWNLKLLRLSTNFKASLDDLKNKANFLGGLVDFERMMAFTPIICHKLGKPTKIVSINYCTFSWVQLWLVMYIQMLWLKAWGYDSKLSTMQPAPAPLPFSLSTYLVKLNWNFIFGVC